MVPVTDGSNIHTPVQGESQGHLKIAGFYFKAEPVAQGM